MWARFLTRLPLRWILGVVLLLLTAVLVGGVYRVIQGPQLPYERRYRTPPVTAAAPLAYLGSSIASMVEGMQENCRLGRFERARIGQSCMAVEVVGGVSSLRSCTAFDFAVNRPEDAVRNAAAQFGCLDVKESFGSMSISVRAGTPQSKDASGAVWPLCGCNAEQIELLGVGSS